MKALINPAKKTECRAEAKKCELLAYKVLETAKFAKVKAPSLRKAAAYEAAARAYYDAGWLYGIGKGVKAEKRILDAKKHISAAEAS